MIPFAIIGSQRSGTTFLRRSLHDHPDIICHGEVFGPGGLGAMEPPLRKASMPSKEQRDADPVMFLDRLLSFHSDGFVGFKLLLAHSTIVMNEIAARGYRLLVLRRENALAKFSSIQIFASIQGPGDRFKRPANDGPDAIKSKFDPGAFERYLSVDRERWAAFDAVRERFAPPCCDLEYCELSWGDGLGRALDFLGAARRPLDAGIQKLNSSDVVSRFENPDVVASYLEKNGLQRWASEGPDHLNMSAAR